MNTAVSRGANVVSNSYGISEFNTMQQFYKDYRHPGHAIVASSGDSEFKAANFPAVIPGWQIVGGTSASSPFIAGVIALAGNSSTYTPAYSYKHAASLFDVVGGINGYCGGDYLCTAVPGYDGPTGLGSPDGIGAF